MARPDVRHGRFGLDSLGRLGEQQLAGGVPPYGDDILPLQLTQMAVLDIEAECLAEGLAEGRQDWRQLRKGAERASLPPVCTQP